jgi:hypothetical protein
MGQRDIRRLLITGAVAVVRWAARKGAPEGAWRARMLAKKPRMLVAIALANRMARVAWAVMRKEEGCREAGRHRGLTATIVGMMSGMWAGRRERRGERSTEPGQENQHMADAPRALVSEMDLTGIHPYGPAAREGRIFEAAHMTAPDHMPIQGDGPRDRWLRDAAAWVRRVTRKLCKDVARDLATPAAEFQS